ncbi:MAG: LacI family DNA-binding transcriptional regulator [Arcanobacterium sp.]|nr:LacI family DNA-binding transcriptional regulator [Arcanobacterium sp.]
MAKESAVSLKKGSTPVIKDVAACAGVSVATVSRYLNGSSHLSALSAQKIARAVEILGYRPSSVARGLAHSRMATIGVLSSNTTLLGSAMAIQGIEDEARSQGYSIMISRLDGESPEDLKRAIDLVLDVNPSGVVVLKYDEVAQRAREMIPRDIPLVVIGGSPEPLIDQISLCEYAGGRRMTEYLLELGHSTVAHIGVPIRSQGTSRADGWESVLKERGIPVPPIIATTWDPADARVVGRQLAHEHPATAIFAGNDEIAMGVIRGLEDAGVRVPDDISVVGFDDHSLAAVWNPGITTYRQNFVAAGRAAVAALLARWEGRTQPPQLVEVAGELVERESARRV